MQWGGRGRQADDLRNNVLPTSTASGWSFLEHLTLYFLGKQLGLCRANFAQELGVTSLLSMDTRATWLVLLSDVVGLLQGT